MLNYFFRNYLFFIFLGLYFVYLLKLSYLSSFIVGGEKYFVLADDMMISMKYAKNLALGNGLVWSPDTRIEGFTNPLWTFYMSFWHLFEIPASKISHVIQLTNILLLGVIIFLVKKIADTFSNKSELTTIFAVALTASYYPLNNMGILGTEVPVMALLIVTAVYLSFVAMEKKISFFWVYLILTVGTFVKTDMAVSFLTFVIFFMIFDRKNIKKHLLFGFGLLFVSILIQTGFRYLYYGNILPNTYYLKMTGYPAILRITRGIYIFLEYVFKTGIILFFIPLLVIKSANIKIKLLGFILVANIIYSFYVGGDIFTQPGRFITVVMPLFFILFGIATARLLVFIFRPGIIKNLVTAFLLVIFIMIFNSTNEELFLEALAINQPSHVGGAKINVEVANKINEIADSNDVVAVSWAGTIPYFTNTNYIDTLGKSDNYIAHQESRSINEEVPIYMRFYPGHTKWDNKYAIVDKKPDIIVSPPYEDEQLKKYINENYEKLYVGEAIVYVKKGKKLFNNFN